MCSFGLLVVVCMHVMRLLWTVQHMCTCLLCCVVHACARTYLDGATHVYGSHAQHNVYSALATSLASDQAASTVHTHRITFKRCTFKRCWLYLELFTP